MWNKTMLFISSYIPLYILMILKNIFERITVGGRFASLSKKINKGTFFDEINDYAIVVLFMLCIGSLIYLIAKVKNTKGEKDYIIKEMTDETSNYYFNYISIYLLSCLGLSLNNITDNFVFVFVMFIVGYIYISNNMIYMNPTLNFLGYKVYDVILDSVNTNDKSLQSIIIISKKVRIKVNDKVKATGKSGFIFASEKLQDDTAD